MNYYELKDFNSITCSELTSKFNGGSTIKKGCISVYDDSIGKPGDTFYSIRNIIQENNDKLIIEFGGYDRIVFTEPEYIVVNSKVIGIQNCKKIEWIDENYTLIYFMDENELKTFSMKGEHSFRVKQDAPAFLFYTW